MAVSWQVYMRQGSNPYSLAHDAGPSAGASEIWKTTLINFEHGISSCHLQTLQIYIYIWYSETPKSSTLGDWGPLPRAARSASWHHLRLHGWALAARNWAENWAEQIGKHVIFEDQISRFRFGTVIIQPKKGFCVRIKSFLNVFLSSIFGWSSDDHPGTAGLCVRGWQLRCGGPQTRRPATQNWLLQIFRTKIWDQDPPASNISCEHVWSSWE